MLVLLSTASLHRFAADSTFQHNMLRLASAFQAFSVQVHRLQAQAGGGVDGHAGATPGIVDLANDGEEDQQQAGTRCADLCACH
jgi:hypothetical protein